MSKHHHHHHHCPSEQEEIIDRILRRCCDDRRPEALLPIELSPEEVREFRCIKECLRRCLCRPIDNFSRVEGAEDFFRRRRD
jgi:hypothetical protein